MFGGTRPNPLNIGAKTDVARNLLPNEIERVNSAPHIGAAAGDSVFALGRVVLNFAAGWRLPYVTFVRENSQTARLRQCHRRGQRYNGRKRTTWQERYFSALHFHNPRSSSRSPNYRRRSPRAQSTPDSRAAAAEARKDTTLASRPCISSL